MVLHAPSSKYTMESLNKGSGMYKTYRKLQKTHFQEIWLLCDIGGKIQQMQITYTCLHLHLSTPIRDLFLYTFNFLSHKVRSTY